MQQYRHLILTACIFSHSLCATGIVMAQVDPQSTFEPRSEPGAGQEFLQKFVGDWDVKKKFFPRAGSPSETTGSCKQSMIHSGRFLKSEFVFGQGGDETTGLGIIGWDPSSKKFTSFWTDSRSTRVSIRQSEAGFDGQQIVLFSRSIDQDSPPTAQRCSKTVTRLEDEGHTLVHRQYSLDSNNHDERLVMELILTRKQPTPAKRK
jgi:Protein of unknown function (DUF1579)